MNDEIPSYDILSFKEKQNRYAALVCTFNEGLRFRNQIRKMIPHAAGCFDVIIADGPSTDGSTDPEYLAQAGVSAIILPATGLGLSSAIRAALHFCLERGYEGIVMVDGHDKDDTSALGEFARNLDHGFDYVQASRFMPGGRAINTPLSRIVLIRLIHAPFFSLICCRRFTDTTNGFRAFSRRFIADDKVALFRDVFDQYELPYYMAWSACHYGFKVKEIPATRAYPEGNVIPTKIRSFRGYWKMLKPMLMLLLRRY